MGKNKDLQKMLTEFEKEFGHIKEWEIDRNNQLASVASEGGKKTLPKGIHTEIQKLGNKKAVATEKGIHSPKYKDKRSEWGSLAGKKGGKSCKEQGKGIHVDDETRKEWARLGGIAAMELRNREQTCPHCNKTSRGGGYFRWHGDNCKQKDENNSK